MKKILSFLASPDATICSLVFCCVSMMVTNYKLTKDVKKLDAYLIKRGAGHMVKVTYRLQGDSEQHTIVGNALSSKCLVRFPDATTQNCLMEWVWLE